MGVLYGNDLLRFWFSHSLLLSRSFNMELCRKFGRSSAFSHMNMLLNRQANTYIFTGNYYLWLFSIFKGIHIMSAWLYCLRYKTTLFPFFSVNKTDWHTVVLPTQRCVLLDFCPTPVLPLALARWRAGIRTGLMMSHRLSMSYSLMMTRGLCIFGLLDKFHRLIISDGLGHICLLVIVIIYIDDTWWGDDIWWSNDGMIWG